MWPRSPWARIGIGVPSDERISSTPPRRTSSVVSLVPRSDSRMRLPPSWRTTRVGADAKDRGRGRAEDRDLPQKRLVTAGEQLREPRRLDLVVAEPHGDGPVASKLPPDQRLAVDVPRDPRAEHLGDRRDDVDRLR